MRAQKRTTKDLSCLFSFIASYRYVGSNESTTSSSFSSSALDSLPLARGDCRCIEGDSSSTINSLKNLTEASTSGVAPPPVSKAPAMRLPFRSQSSVNRFRDGGRFTSSCKTAFAKHMFLVFTSPRARRRGTVALQIEPQAGMEELMEGGEKCEELETGATPAT